ncbi:MAG TPA: GatB/YqeY domain-containing protein [Thermomicrobiales bacterium]|nr:GatB/YqeY domain-containing protein [Thermomicrobiales bacterium]
MSDITLKDQVTADMKQAMKDRDTSLRDTLRLILSSIKNAEIDKRSDLTADESQAVLRKEGKQRQDSIEQYRAAGREDLASQEELELSIIERYLPQQMTDEELAAFVQAGIAETGASSPKEMGKVMGLLNARTENRVDGRRLSAAVREALAAVQA